MTNDEEVKRLFAEGKEKAKLLNTLDKEKDEKRYLEVKQEAQDILDKLGKIAKDRAEKLKNGFLDMM